MSRARETEPIVWQPLLPWQEAAAKEALAARERWPHALLIAGRRGIGKRRLALYFAQSLLCEAPRGDRTACGRCPSCAYVAAGAHPDLRLIEPVERDEEGNAKPVDAILVDRIRELIDFAQLTTHRQRAKVALIAPAEAMNAAAANALLKTLEEPPPSTYLLLVSDQPGRLLATVVSRCRLMPAPEPGRNAARDWLAAQGVERAELKLAQAGGAPLLALALADPALQRERDALLDALAQPERLSPLAFGARLDAHPRDERGARLADTVHWLLAWTSDLAAVASGGEPRFHPDRRDALASLGARVARVTLFRYYRTLLRQRELLSHPLQPRLVAEALLFEYRTAFSREQGTPLST
ncbi:MAG TPA: DNA polymerase III subunit delta' [Casimicrobiaceae bacterium]|nr:DNA polymerase III subunit delta' [Casimicrobiaceae bacterium]